MPKTRVLVASALVMSVLSTEVWAATTCQTGSPGQSVVTAAEVEKARQIVTYNDLNMQIYDQIAQLNAQCHALVMAISPSTLSALAAVNPLPALPPGVMDVILSTIVNRLTSQCSRRVSALMRNVVEQVNEAQGAVRSSNPDIQRVIDASIDSVGVDPASGEIIYNGQPIGAAANTSTATSRQEVTNAQNNAVSQAQQAQAQAQAQARQGQMSTQSVRPMQARPNPNAGSGMVAPKPIAPAPAPLMMPQSRTQPPTNTQRQAQPSTPSAQPPKKEGSWFGSIF